MTLLDNILNVAAPPTAAEAHARRNWSANWRALMGSQPRLLDQIDDHPATDLTWIYGRDGALTAMLPGGAGERWWAGCSVPRRAAHAMLGKLDATGVTACLLAPSHAAQVTACLDRMDARQALFVVVPEIESLRVMLHCEDFSPFVRAHRLWLAAGEGWVEQLDEVLTVYPGLPTPSQFVRLPDVPEEDLERYTRPAKQLFAKHTSTRGEMLRAAQRSTKRPTPAGAKRRICVIAPQGFTLWETAGAAAASALTALAESAPLSVLGFNSDDPLLASPVALAQAVAECDAVVAANLYRSDLPGVVPDHVAWITWLTTAPRTAAFDSAHPRDAVLVADPAWQPLLVAAGWPATRIAQARWPEVLVTNSDDAEPALAIVADTCNVDIDLTTLELSSHRLLWSQIRHDIAVDPFAVGDDPDAYLSRVLRAHRVPDEGLDRARFVRQLIVPAYQQALVRLLTDHHLPVRLFGRGWDEIADFERLADGPVTTPEQLDRILAGATALVHCWPTRHPHPIAAVRKPLVPRCTDRKELIATAWDRFSKPQASQRALRNPFEAVIRLLG